MSLKINNINFSAVIVLFNPSNENIKNIFLYKGVFNEIVIVDNSLIDNRSKFENLLSENISYFPLLKNTGIAYALNFGIKKSDPKINYVITLDQDSNFTIDIIKEYQRILNEIENEDTVLCPNIRSDRSKEVIADGYNKVNLAIQSGMLINKSVFNKVGYFQDELFIDVVDYEFCLRLKQSNIPIYRCNKAILKHQPATTYKKNFILFSLKYGVASPLRYYYQIRNLLYVFKKYRCFPLLLIFFFKLFKIIFLFDNKKSYLIASKKAIRDFLHNKLGEYND